MPENPFSSHLLNTSSQKKWKKIGAKKRSGILVPLFSLYSQNSVGIGDLEDLHLLVDWCLETGNSTIQFLPLNETGSLFCPYDAFSSFALEPLYLAFNKIPFLDKKALQPKLEELRAKFASSSRYVDYGIKKEKLKLFWDIFTVARCLLPEADNFIAENKYWLEDFALFKVLKDTHQGRPWYEWEDKYKNREAAALAAFSREHEEELNFQVWLQWLLYGQLQRAKAYANAKGIIFKGDLPILVSRDSADVWAHPEFFKLEFAAGAPADMYAALGQRWGMPTYNWERIASDGYRYLKEKLKYAENFYDILRIDHVVGLFRIWSIPYAEPLENMGLNGTFDPADEGKWREHGRNILSVMLESTSMLLCAEDLGVIPAACPEALWDFGIPGNDVQRWMKDWKARHDFLKPQEYRMLSVAMLSTHDTTNWAGWWENEAGTVDEALFMRRCAGRIDYNAVGDKLFDPKLSGHGRLRWLNSINSVDKLLAVLGKPKEEVADFIDMYENTYHEKEKLWKHFGFFASMREKCDTNIIKHALRITLDSSAIFCINTLVDWLYLTDIFKGDSYAYRINTPGTISDKNWSLRIPIPLEELLKYKVCGEIKKMVVASGRV